MRKTDVFEGGGYAYTISERLIGAYVKAGYTRPTAIQAITESRKTSTGMRSGTRATKGARNA
jgi:hypothetical protein